MANVTDKSILTAAGKALLAQLNAEEKALVIDKMIFANVPNRPEYPQPDDVVPSNDVVHEAAVEQRGRLSVDSVIYSTTLTSQEGPFEFNWTGAYCSEYGVLVTIDHHALTPKTADEPGVSGNTLVRSVVLEYKDIAEITNITVDASTWQYNATPRMKKMDDDVAQANIDQNGKDWFIEDGFLVTPQASAFNIKAGAGYVSGNRVTLEFDRNVQVPNKPSFIYVDAHREGTPTGEQVILFDFVVTAEEKDDYTAENGVKHFVCKIAQVLSDGSVSDLRPEGDSKIYVKEKIAEVDKIYSRNFKSIADLMVGKSSDGSEVDLYQMIGQRVEWRGYYTESDGGSNWGIVKKGLHVYDGGSILTLAPDLYIEASLKGRTINVKKFGAKGDGIADDEPPITTALKYVGSSGGGTVILPKTKGRFRIVKGLKIPKFVTLQGFAKSRYPYNGVDTSSALVADFTDFRQWVVEPDTKHDGLPIPYNETMKNKFPTEASYNCSVQDLQITSVGIMPYGGVRMIGCPGASIDNVSVIGTSIGLLVNFCFGGNFSIHTLTHHYGTIIWESANANEFEIYSNKISDGEFVPEEYIPPFLRNLEGSLVTHAKLSTEDHYRRTWGLVIGSDSGTTACGNNINYTGEKFSGGCFQYYSYGTSFDKFYVEGNADQMKFGMVSAYSRWTSDNYHCYLSAAKNNLFDLGVENQIRASIVGLREGSYGYGPYKDTSSLVVFDAVRVSDLPGFKPQFNVSFTNSFSEGEVSDFNANWRNNGSIFRNAGFVRHDQTNNIHLRGTITGGRLHEKAFTLPEGYRPPYTIDFAVAGGEIRVSPSGDVIPTNGQTLFLDQVSFDVY